MNINDILDLPEFDSLDRFLTEEMRKTAGRKIMKMMRKTFQEEYMRDWYYTDLTVFNGKRAYDMCKENKHKEVYRILNHIIYGSFS